MVHNRHRLAGQVDVWKRNCSQCHAFSEMNFMFTYFSFVEKIQRNFLQSQRLGNFLSRPPMTFIIILIENLSLIKMQGLWIGEYIKQSLRAFLRCFAN